MAGTTVPVSPGPPQQIGGSVPKGSLIYNTDAVNGVWISDRNNVSPGNGTFVGALGTVDWSNNGVMFACVDTGVSAPVNVTISSDANNPTNPVAVGLSVAAQLLATGVPNVLLQSLLFQTTLPHLAAGQSVTIPVTKYATAIITAACSPTDLSGSYVLEVQQQDAGGGTLSDEWLTNVVGAAIGVGPVPTTWEVPLAGAQIVITNRSTGHVFLSVEGSNRNVVSAQMLNQTYAPRLFSFTGALVIGTPVNINTATDGITAQGTAMNGEVQVSLNASIAGVQGELLMNYRTPANTAQSLVMSGAVTLPAIVRVPHPLAGVSWGWFPSTAAGAVTLAANVIQVNRGG